MFKTLWQVKIRLMRRIDVKYQRIIDISESTNPGRTISTCALKREFKTSGKQISSAHLCLFSRWTWPRNYVNAKTRLKALKALKLWCHTCTEGCRTRKNLDVLFPVHSPTTKSNSFINIEIRLNYLPENNRLMTITFIRITIRTKLKFWLKVWLSVSLIWWLMSEAT